MSQFDESGAYNYELAIPLKYLASVTKGGEKLNYQIILNSISEDERFGSSISYKYVRNGGESTSVLQDQDLHTATDLSGEYILAKK